MAFWKAKMFTMAGRLVLLNTVLSAFMLYRISIHELPAWARSEIDRLRRAWLWRGDVVCHGGHCKVAWGKICRPRDLGRLGNIDIVRFSSAMRMCWHWHERVSPAKPWVGLPTPCTMQDRGSFAAGCAVTAGNGKRISFWFDGGRNCTVPTCAGAI